jgi:hypothetical protein
MIGCLILSKPEDHVIAKHHHPTSAPPDRLRREDGGYLAEKVILRRIFLSKSAAGESKS